MKKLLFLLILCLSVFAFTACGDDGYEDDDDDYRTEEQDDKDRKDDKDTKDTKDDKDSKDGKDDKADKTDGDNTDVQPTDGAGKDTDDLPVEEYWKMILGDSWHYGPDHAVDCFYTFHEDGTWEMYGEGGADEFGTYWLEGNILKLDAGDYEWEMTIVSSEKLINSEGEELMRYVPSDYYPDDDPDDIG